LRVILSCYICVGGWRSLTTLFIWALAVTSYTIAATSSAGDQSVISRLNYGVVMKRVAVVDVVTSVWNQAFIVRLPSMDSAMSGPSDVNCSGLANRFDRAACVRLRPLVLYLHNASRRAVDKIQTVIHYIRALVPDHTRRRRVGRGLIDLGGDLLHGLFGTARDSDIDHVRHTLAELRRQNVQTMVAWKDVSGRLASLVKASNRRISSLHSMVETQERAITTLFQEVSSEAVESAKAASLLASALTRLEDFILLLDNLERLSAAVEDLVHGVLSPVLISPEDLRHSLDAIDVRVRSHRSGLRVLRKTPSYYYGLHHFVTAREGDNLVINIHIPLTDLPRHLPVYQVHVLPVPVSNSDDHATLVTNIPKIFMPFPSYTYHIRFDSLPEIRASNLIYLDETKGFVEGSDSMECIIAIMQNEKSAVEKRCKFNLVTNSAKPQIFVIDRLHIVLTKVNATIRCPAKPVRLINCSFTCQVTLPCRCDLRSPLGFVPQRLDDCVQHRDVQVQHHVNLALLQNFFSESQLKDISGDTLLPDPLKVMLPPLKIFQAEFSHEVEEDKRAKFDLEQISNLTKEDKEAFASLAHSMVSDWQEYRGRSFENDFIFGSWKSWVMTGIGVIAVVTLIFSITLSYRVRALSSSLALLSMTTKVHALPVELNFYSTTAKPLVPNQQFTVPTELICDIIIMALLAVFVVFVVFLWYKKRRSYKFDLYLHVGNQNECRRFWIRSFWLEPALYTFTATRYIDSVSVDGWVFPRMIIDWPTLSIRSNATNQEYALPRSVPLSWGQRNFLSSVLGSRYWCVMVTNYNDHFALLDLPARDWDEVPAYDRGLRGHMTHAASLSTLTPTAPGIYPQLSTVSEDVKD